MTILNLFVTSERPDPYINAIAYCVEHRKVDTIRLITISGHGYPDERSKALALSVLSNIRSQLVALGEGRYLEFDPGSDPEAVDAFHNADARAFYGNLLTRIERDCRVSTQVISHSELDAELLELGKDAKSYFDVTALRKSLLVDVTALLISRGVRGVHTFELLRAQRYDITDLYHDLRFEQDYVYRELTDSAPVSQAIARMERPTIRLRWMLTLLSAVSLLSLVVGWRIGGDGIWIALSAIGSVASVVGVATSFADRP